MVPGGEQRADVALQDEVRLPGPLDGLDDLGVGGVDEVAHLAADPLLPRRQRVDVGVDARVPRVCHQLTIVGAPGASGQAMTSAAAAH